jgi:tRNA pseudouridine38-40 synthase
MRWRIQLSYLGTRYCGWQKQPGDPSVQQTLEEAFSMILRQPVEIVGCGRTDSGVHARKYIAHADIEELEMGDKRLYQLNSVLPEDIVIQSIAETNPAFHARFDAVERCYRYYIHFKKDPFLQGQSFFLHHHGALNQIRMQNVASLLMQYQQFEPFCKTGSDADHFKCKLVESNWYFNEGHAVYTIRANRFLRGMVRLIVGACLNVGLGKISLQDVETSLENQLPVAHAWSVPPEGLFLEDISYPV